jgi:hypothetical protein
MEWRSIDNLIASACVQEIQKQIKSGKLKASDMIPMITNEAKAKELFNAWRVYFIDRMANEHDKGGWANEGEILPSSQIEHDIEYYNTIERYQKETGRTLQNLDEIVAKVNKEKGK